MLKDLSTIQIGSGAENTIIIKDAVAEKNHATVRLLKNGQLEIIDNNTKYGTYINNTRVNHAILNSNESVQIGFSRIHFNELLSYFDKINEPKQTLDNTTQITESQKKGSIANSVYPKGIVEVYPERPKFLPVIVPKKIRQIKTKSYSLTLLMIAPFFALFCYYSGNYIALRNNKKQVIIPYQSYIPFVPLIENSFNKTPVFADCVNDKEFKAAIIEATPEFIKTNNDTTLIFEKICDEFDDIKSNKSVTDKAQMFIKSLLSENAKVSVFKDKISNKIFCLICIGQLNKFSIKHYINKRYELQAASSFEAEIYTINDQQMKVWLLLDFDENYPGKTSIEPTSKGKFYRFDLDRCEFFSR